MHQGMRRSPECAPARLALCLQALDTPERPEAPAELVQGSGCPAGPATPAQAAAPALRAADHFLQFLTAQLSSAPAAPGASADEAAG